MAGVVVVGASDRTPWSYWLMRNVDHYRYPAPVWLVNPRQESIFGRPCAASIAAIEGTPSVGALMLRADAAVDAARDLIDRGVGQILAVSAGFAETGTHEGRALQDELVKICDSAGVSLYGPNCVGFASFHDNLCAIAEPVPLDVRPGSVSVVSQSGALMSAAMSALVEAGLGLDECFSIGNGAAFDLCAAIDRVSAREQTTVVAIVLESVGEPADFAAAIARGAAAGVQFVAFRLGRSDRGRGIAQSHTGAVVGSDVITAAWLDRLGVRTADSLDELAALTALVARPSTRSGGVFIVSGSGGGAGFAADLAERHGMRLAQPSASTVDTIAGLLPTGALISNPLDMVGGSPTSRAQIYEAVHADPDVAVVLESYTVMWPDDGVGRSWHRDGMLQLAGAQTPGVATMLASVFSQPPTPWLTGYAHDSGVTVVPDLDVAIRALAVLHPVAGLADAEHAQVATKPGAVDGTESAVVAEAAGRELFDQLGLPLVRGVHAIDAAAAVLAAGTMPGPFVVKIALDTVGHKGRIGGVRVGIPDADAVGVACTSIEESARSAGALGPESAKFLLQQMAIGPEVLVGFLRDSRFGAVVNIGIGGWAAELGRPAITSALPVDVETLGAAVRGSGLAAALGEVHAAALVDLVGRLADEFESGALTDFAEVECNPVMLTADGPVIADVLLIRS